jgi:hypothetical protein
VAKQRNSNPLSNSSFKRSRAAGRDKGGTTSGTSSKLTSKKTSVSKIKPSQPTGSDLTRG